jgi:hypothetical protein
MADKPSTGTVLGLLGGLAALGALALGGKKPARPAAMAGGPRKKPGACGGCGR